jgi:thiol-disulfide isomerase/thioredoxin
MRVLLLILMLITPKPPQIFSATGMYAPQVQDKTTTHDPAADEYYAAMFTAEWCSPCREYKKPGGKLDKLKSLLPGTVVIDVDLHPDWKADRKVRNPEGKIVTHSGVTQLPTLWLIRKRDQWPVKMWTPGAVSPDEIYSLAASLTEQDRTNVK